MERQNNEGQQPDECDVGRNLPNTNGQTGVERVWTTVRASHGRTNNVTQVKY